MPDPIATPYSDALQDLYDSSGDVETLINSNGGNAPTAAQSTLLNFLQGPLKGAIQTAANDPDLPAMPVPGTQP